MKRARRHGMTRSLNLIDVARRPTLTSWCPTLPLATPGMDELIANFFSIVEEFKKKPYDILDFTKHTAWMSRAVHHPRKTQPFLKVA